jgi:hypothetical protein
LNLLHFFDFLKLQEIDLSKQYITPQGILAVKEQLLRFINEEVIQPAAGRHHVPKFVIGQEFPPLPSLPRKRNALKKNQRGSDSSVNKKSK